MSFKFRYGTDIVMYYKWRHPGVSEDRIPARYKISLWTGIKKPIRTYKKINCVFRNVVVNGDPIEMRKDVRIQFNIPFGYGIIKYEKSLNNR